MKSIKIKINVTAADLKRGEMCNGGSCPIARALMRRLPKSYKHAQVHITTYNAGICIPKGFLFAPLPEEARSFIQKFDNKILGKNALKPFAFTLNFD